MASPVRELVKVEGIVQGVGFRPFVFNLAESLKLSGHVFNHSKGVDIELEGAREAIDAFKERLTAHPPPLAHITRISAAPKEALGEKGFYIKESQGAGAKTALVAPDSDVCPDCLRELFDPGDRRYRYPFINCTNCGPRFTIIHGIPYDRPNTTMSVFPMCDDCRAEYEDPRDRRFHAQPVACPACGPRLTFRDESFHPAGSEDPVADAARTIRKGGAVAVKGIGGYHLAVDAENEDAVLRLRERKRRDEKPFAVMFPDIDTLRGFARVGAAEASLLESRAHPITLVEKIDKDILPGAAPANRYIGAMVPYTPIHHLLLKEGPFTALVMTSAGIERYLTWLGEPTEPPTLAPARGPPFFKSRVIRRRLGEPVQAELFDTH